MNEESREKKVNFFNEQSLDFKWRVYMFGMTLKQYSISANWFEIVFFILEMAAYIFPAIYQLLAYSDETEIVYDYVSEIFPHSTILAKIVDALTVDLVLLVTMLYLIFTIISFFWCVLEPKVIERLHTILCVRVHICLLPFVTAIFCYSIEQPFHVSSDPFMIILFSLIFVSFIIYLPIISILNFFHSNTFCKPSLMTAQWFTSYSVLYPLYIAVNAAIGIWSLQVSKTAAYVALSIGAILSLFISIFSYREQPFILFFANEAFTTKTFLNALVYIMAIVMMSLKTAPISSYFEMVPVCGTVIFCIVHFFYSKRTKSSNTILQQISPAGNNPSTEEAIETTLQSFTTEREYRMLYKSAFLVGNNTIFTPEVLKLCLKKFPRSEWFTSATVMTYALVWEGTPDIYRFFLHLLSTGDYHFTTEFLLFQYIFYWQGVANNISPVIARELSKLRSLSLRYSYGSKVLWESTHEQDNKKFVDVAGKLFNSYSQMRAQMSLMLHQFPYCPAVLAEASSFYADTYHDYEKAAEMYTRAENLINNPNYISDDLVSSYSSFLPTPREKEVEEEESGVYKFLSKVDSSTDMSRQSQSLLINDDYISNLMHTYTISKNSAKITPNIEGVLLSILYVILFVVVVVYIVLFVIHFNKVPEMYNVSQNYTEIMKTISETLNFRVTVSTIRIGIYTITNIENNTYPMIPLYDGFEENYMSSFRKLENLIYLYKDIADELKTMMSINLSMPTCTSSRFCTFDSYVGLLHDLFLFYTSANLTTTETTFTLDQVDSLTDDFDALTLHIYDQLYDKLKTSYKDGVNTTKKFMIIILVIEWLFPIIVSITVYFLNRRIRQSLLSVIRTCQPPVAQNIANMFRNVLNFRGKEIKQENYFCPSIPFIMLFSFFIMSIFPIHSIFILQVLQPDLVDKLEVVPLINVTETTAFLFLSSSVIDYRAKQTQFNWTRSFLNITSPEADMNVFQLLINKTTAFDQPERIDSLTYINSFLCVISLVCFHYSINAFVEIITQLRKGMLLLKSIPLKAARSSPIYNKLLRAESITYAETDQFEHDLMSIPEDLGFFTVIKFNDKGEVTKTMGNTEKFIGTVPKTIDELKATLVSNSDCSESEMDNFITNHNDTLSILLDGDKDVIIHYDGKQMIIIDDSNHAAENSRLRSEKKLTAPLDALISRKQESMSNIILVGIAARKESTLELALDAATKEGVFTLTDARYKQLILAAPLEGGVPHCISFIKSLKQKSSDFAAIFDICDNLFYFPQVRNQIGRCRWVGKSFESVKKFLFSSPPQQVYASRRFSELAGIQLEDAKSLVSQNETIEIGIINT